MGQGLDKSRRLRRRREFVDAYETGTPYRNAGFHLFARRRPRSGNSRLGITVTRAVGNAVVRNRLRRWTRERFRLMGHRVRPDYDLVVNLHPRLATMSHGEFDRLLVAVLAKADVLED